MIGYVAGNDIVACFEVEPHHVEAVTRETRRNGGTDSSAGSGHNSGGHYGFFLMAYKVSLDSDECMSAGRCIASAPGFFVFDDDEIATIDPSGTQPDDAELLKIARTCPSGAIKLFDGAHEVDI